MQWFPYAVVLGAVFSAGCTWDELRERRPRPRVLAAWGFCTGAFCVLALIA
jgi:hypothetical protein